MMKRLRTSSNLLGIQNVDHCLNFNHTTKEYQIISCIKFNSRVIQLFSKLSLEIHLQFVAFKSYSLPDSLLIDDVTFSCENTN